MVPKEKQIVTRVIVVIIGVLACASFSFAGSAPNMQEGLWEITSKMEMPGMPMNMPPSTHTQCITDENLVPRGSQESGECTITETNVKGDTVTWTMECDTPEGKTRATGKITYQGDTFKGTIKMTMQGMEMTQHLSARRIGNCPQ